MQTGLPLAPWGFHYPEMKALLLRVGIDSTDGGWRAPVLAATGISDAVPMTKFPGDGPGFRRRSGELSDVLESFAVHLRPRQSLRSNAVSGHRAPTVEPHNFCRLR